MTIKYCFWIYNLSKDRKDDQIEKQQDTVRIHFPIFSRCSHGIDIFGDNEDDNDKRYSKQASLHIKKLENIADESEHVAMDSFKPLLDNTTEVRSLETIVTCDWYCNMRLILLWLNLIP